MKKCLHFTFQLAAEKNIKFYETSAQSNINIDEVRAELLPSFKWKFVSPFYFLLFFQSFSHFLLQFKAFTEICRQILQTMDVPDQVKVCQLRQCNMYDLVLSIIAAVLLIWLLVTEDLKGQNWVWVKTEFA